MIGVENFKNSDSIKRDLKSLFDKRRHTMFGEISEIMKTESFLSLIIGASVLVILTAMIAVDRYRYPEIYSRKQIKPEGEKNGNNL